MVLHDNGNWIRFAPLTLTRPIGELRMGIFTNSERWKFLVDTAEIYYSTEHYLSKKFLSCSTPDVTINACLIPSRKLMEAILELAQDDCLMLDNHWLAKKGTGTNVVQWTEECLLIDQRWHLFQFNEQAIFQDFELVSHHRTSQLISANNTIIGDPSLIFSESGAKVEASVLNTTNGPIYIGKNAEIMEGSLVRGPLAMLPDSALKLGTKVYGATTLGPHCKVGGEVNNVIFQGYSNKGHDGFLGNALIGEWCNLGADTNASNLKNNYGSISTYSYETKSEVETNTQFMGLCMSDHSKCGINTMFNTATVVGVSSNVFGAEFPPKFIPSFSWGGTSLVTFNFEKAIEYSNNMMQRRGLKLSDEDVEILRYIADTTK